MHRLLASTLLLSLFAPVSSPAIEDLGAPPIVTAVSWAIADATDGKLLWSHLPDEPRKAASTTKTMCALVVLELAKADPAILEEQIEVSTFAAATDGSTAELEAGDQLNVRDGLYALLLPSGNDMGNAFAEHFNARLAPPGDETPASAKTSASAARMNFVAEMNRTAQRLGMNNTSYRIAYGDGGTADDRTTTAQDLVTLAMAARLHPLLREVVATKEKKASLRGKDGSEREVTWKNTNLLLEIGGYDGIKTGTTPSAGRCLVASGTRDGKSLIVVSLGSTSDEGRFADSRNLFRWAWSKLAAAANK